MPITAVPPPDEAAKEAERQALKRDMNRRGNEPGA